MTDIVLLTPPPDMRQACCDGLAAREQAGKGGTARSVPFASRVCAGGPVTADDLVDMLTHMAAIADAMIERGLGDRALAVAWDLWGGDAGREWAEAFVYRPAPVMAAPTPAAPAEVEVVKVRWVDDLNRLARGERELLARIHELMEAGVEIAVNRLRHKVVNGLQRPSAALKAAFSGLHHRDELLAAIAAAEDDVAAVRCLPSPILAKLAPGIESDEKLRAVFGQLGQRVVTLVGEHQQQVIGVLRDAGASTVHLSECSTLMAADLSMAVDMATAELMDLIARLARDEAADPEGELPTGRVASSLAFRLLSAAGGGDPGDGNRQDWVHLGQGEVLAAGVALGVTSLRFLGRAIQAGSIQAAVGTLTVDRVPTLDVVTVTTWHWGGSSRPFPPHQQLHGQSWSSEQERSDVCVNTGRFPAVGAFYPGDHRGCSCSFEVELRIVQTAKGAATVRLPDDSAGFKPLWSGGDKLPPTPVHPVKRPPHAPGEKVTWAGAPDRDQEWIGTTASGKKIKIDGGFEPVKTAAQRAHYDTIMGQAQRTADALSEYALPAKASRYPVGDVLVQFRPDLDGSHGVSRVGEGTIFIDSALKGKATDWAAVRPGYGDVEHFAPFATPNAAKVTDVEYTLAHEWGHTLDSLDREAAGEKLYASLTTSQFPSGYAATDWKELFAEAFADWVIDPATAHPTSKLIAKSMGWKVPATPLATVSALAGA